MSQRKITDLQKVNCEMKNTSSIVQKFIALELYYINVNQQITDTKMHRNIKWVQNWDQYDIFRWLVNVGLLQKSMWLYLIDNFFH